MSELTNHRLMLRTLKWTEHTSDMVADMIESFETENAELRSLLNEAITDHVGRYDLPESEDFIERVKTALGEEAKP